MGEHSCLGDDVDCYSVDKVTIGTNSTVSQYSFLCTASHDIESVGFELITAPINIGENVWIAADVFVCPGVSIGNNAVVYARANVLNDVEPGSVVGPVGNRSLRQRRLQMSNVIASRKHK
jgi:putative colanic acid biosynthesis acetyltransferase WcaF